MGFFFQPSSRGLFRRNDLFGLAFTWLSGIVIGSLVSFRKQEFLSSLLDQAVCTQASLIGTLSASILPLLFSAFLMNLIGTRLLIPISFCSGFLVSFFSWTAFAAFGNAGWLVVPMLFFSSCFMIPVLWLFWIRCVRTGSISHFLPFLLIGFLVGWVDFSLISPFLREILSL